MQPYARKIKFETVGCAGAPINFLLPLTGEGRERIGCLTKSPRAPIPTLALPLKGMGQISRAPTNIGYSPRSVGCARAPKHFFEPQKFDYKMIPQTSTKPNPLPFKGRVRVGMGLQRRIIHDTPPPQPSPVKGEGVRNPLPFKGNRSAKASHRYFTRAVGCARAPKHFFEPQMFDYKMIPQTSEKPNPLTLVLERFSRGFKGRVRVGMGVRDVIAELLIQNNHA
jgi:hypothetical protein